MITRRNCLSIHNKIAAAGALFLCCLGSLGIAAPAPKPDIHFILIQVAGEQPQIISPLPSTVELDEHHLIAWYVNLPAGTQASPLREIYSLPKPAKWGIDPEKPQTVAADQKSCTTLFSPGSKQVSLGNVWGMYPEDPTGEYQLKVFQGETLLGKTTFQVINKKPKQDRPETVIPNVAGIVKLFADKPNLALYQWAGYQSIRKEWLKQAHKNTYLLKAGTIRLDFEVAWDGKKAGIRNVRSNITEQKKAHAFNVQTLQGTSLPPFTENLIHETGTSFQDTIRITLY